MADRNGCLVLPVAGLTPCRRLSARIQEIDVRRNGFTLMELLVSVGIIAVLMAIFIPALPYALQRAEDAVCRSHLHGTAQAFQMYAAANRGFAPESSSVPWHELLRPYAPSQQVFRCPSDLFGDDALPSYSWRNVEEAPGRDIRRVHAARGNAVLLFDFQAGWHRESFYNVSLVDTSAHSYTHEQFDDDMARALQ
jgi:prepilin-type N-terminal cleavage/methylation domain-containing protein